MFTKTEEFNSINIDLLQQQDFINNLYYRVITVLDNLEHIQQLVQTNNPMLKVNDINDYIENFKDIKKSIEKELNSYK